MSQNLKLSVIIPTLNRPDDLVVAIKSILVQSRLPDELIIVDQSIDAFSYNNIKNLFLKVSFKTSLIYIHDPLINGLVSAKDHGVKKSSGDIISFLEDDEVLSKRYLENVVNAFKTNKQLLGCSGIVSNIRRSFFYEVMFKVFHRGLFIDKRVDVIKHNDCYGSGTLIYSTHLSGGLSSYRSEVFKQIKYDLKNPFFYCEDIDFSIRASDFFGINRFAIVTNICLIHYMSNINRDVLEPRWRRKTNEFILLYKKHTNKKYAFNNVLWLMIGLYFEAIFSSIINRSFSPLFGYFKGLFSGIFYKLDSDLETNAPIIKQRNAKWNYSNKSTSDKEVKNIIFLTKYGTLAASSRLRAYQFKDKINSTKLNIEVQSLLSNRYLEKKFNNKSVSIFYIFYLCLKRFCFLFNLRKYDVVVIHFELFPFMPPIFEWALFKTNKKIYFDYDDAVFHNYDLSNNLYIKLFLSRKIKYLMKMSEGIIAGNDYLQEYAYNSGTKRVLKMPTVIDLDHYASNPPKHGRNQKFTIGWIGSPSTTKYLEIIKEPLSRLGLKIPILLYLVGADNKFDLAIDNIEIISIPWSEEREQEALKVFDVGVMPLYDNAWEKGKCAFKLIQYMASFLPVIASNVGMNAEIINNYGNGFIVKTPDDWYDFFYKIYSHPELKNKMGMKGRELVEKKFTIQSRLTEFEDFVSL